MAATTSSAKEPTRQGVAVPYWPRRALKVATASGLSSLAGLGFLMHFRMPPPATVLRGAIALEMADVKVQSAASDAEDVQRTILLLWFAGLITAALLTHTYDNRKGDSNGVPYWPLRAARIASTSALCTMMLLGVFSRCRTPPQAALLRGAITASATSNETIAGGLELNHAVVMVWFCLLAFSALFTQMYCDSRDPGNGVPYWPLRAARLASMSAFCAFSFAGLFPQLRPAVSAAVLRGTTLARAPAILLEPERLLAAESSFAKLAFQYVGVIFVITAFGAQVYNQAASALKFRDDLNDDPKKVTKQQ